MIKRHRFVTGGNQFLVQHIQHLEEGHVGADAVKLIVAEATGLVRSRLTPDSQSQIQSIAAHDYL